MTTTPATAPTATSAPAVVRLRALRRTYGAVSALDGVDLDVLPGTFIAVMGPSGSGKSTLLQCAAGLDRPTSGTVEVGGTELTGLSERRLTLLRRDRIGFVFQSFNLVPSLTAAQNVALPLRLAGRPPSRARVREALAAVGLDARARHLPSRLSGGQQQRVALARALITRPAVLFGDEPTGALDTTTGRAVLVMLRELVDREGLTLIMVTHDPAAASYADRVLFLVDGRLVGELASPSAGQVSAAMTDLETAAPTPGPASTTAPAPANRDGRAIRAAASRAPGPSRPHTTGGSAC
jgi:putative ABC transport system ATP-binding protein